MPDVTIPADLAKHMAAAWRAYAEGDVIQTGSEVRAWADLLDPRPPSLDALLCDVLADTWDDTDLVNMVTGIRAVVADWLATQPLVSTTASASVWSDKGAQRAADVALLRGEAS